MELKNYLKSPKTHLIFDLDETLVHLIFPWEKWETPIEDDLIKVDKSIYENYVNHKINLSQLMNSYISKYPKTKKLIINNSQKFESENLQDIVVNNELVSFVKNAKSYQMFIWSSNTGPTVEKVLEKLKIKNKFKKIVSQLDVDLVKPEPEGFYLIYDPKIPKENYLFIGNSKADRQAAEKVGVDFYLIDYFK